MKQRGEMFFVRAVAYAKGGISNKFMNASLAMSPPLQGRVKASYLISEKRQPAASLPKASEESPPFKEEFFKSCQIAWQNILFPDRD
jgi:hypothetical protein